MASQPNTKTVFRDLDDSDHTPNSCQTESLRITSPLSISLTSITPLTLGGEINYVTGAIGSFISLNSNFVVLYFP